MDTALESFSILDLPEDPAKLTYYWPMKSFTPTSLIVPITRISLQGDEKKDIYSCSEGNCSVDLQSQSALDKMTANAKIEEGKYNKFGVSYCSDNPAGCTFKSRQRCSFDNYYVFFCH